jgi:hypothetical protein
MGQGSVDMKHGEGNNTTVSYDLKLVSNFRLYRIGFVSMKSSSILDTLKS